MTVLTITTLELLLSTAISYATVTTTVFIDSSLFAARRTDVTRRFTSAILYDHCDAVSTNGLKQR